jgi:KipI family sensor histidine kinase inhibitor
VRILTDSGQAIRPRFAPVGECALTIEFGEIIDPEINRRVLALDRAIAVSDLPGIVETVPTFRSLLVVYEPEAISYATLVAALTAACDAPAASRTTGGRLWRVPIAYDVPGNDDFRLIQDRTGLNRDEVIGLHGATELDVYLIGFMPGMPIMGALPEALRVPRRPEPLPGVPAGRVLIAAAQVEIVTMTMWTGWYCLGLTPIRPYDPGAPNPFRFRAGDRVRFQPITFEELETLKSRPISTFLEDEARS